MTRVTRRPSNHRVGGGRRQLLETHPGPALCRLLVERGSGLFFPSDSALDLARFRRAPPTTGGVSYARAVCPSERGHRLLVPQPYEAGRAGESLRLRRAVPVPAHRDHRRGGFACCLPDPWPRGSCEDLTEEDCITNDGVWSAHGICGNSGQDCGWFPCRNAEGSCCAEHDSTACTDFSCCSNVCDVDSFCCEWEWDAICVREAKELCCPEAAVAWWLPPNGVIDGSHIRYMTPRRLRALIRSELSPPLTPPTAAGNSVKPTRASHRTLSLQLRKVSAGSTRLRSIARFHRVR